MVYTRVKIIIKPNVQELVTSNKVKNFFDVGKLDNGLLRFRNKLVFCLKYKRIQMD